MFGIDIPGIAVIASVTGIGVASWAVGGWLRNTGREMLAQLVDIAAYLAGGVITLSFFMKVLHEVARMFGL